MLHAASRNEPQRIVVLNPKGGCGKTTLATNLASYFSLRGRLPALIDCDPQGASMRWLENRPPERPPIHGIAAFRQPMYETRSWQLRVPAETERIIVDTPAALEGPALHDVIYDADNVLIPVMPSPIDIRYAARFIADLLLLAQLDRGHVRVGVVANRTRRNTRSMRQLMRFLSSLHFPVITVLRDSQNYVTAAAMGLGVYEMPHYRAGRDTADMANIVDWLTRSNAPRRMSAAHVQSGEEQSLPPRRPQPLE